MNQLVEWVAMQQLKGGHTNKELLFHAHGEKRSSFFKDL